MKNLNQYIQEKYLIDSDTYLYNDIFGDGEIKRFGACKLPFEDIIESYQKDEIVDMFRKKYNIQLDTEIFFMIGTGASHCDMKEPKKEFLKAIEKCKPENIDRIDDWGPEVNIRIYTLKKYYDNKDVLVIQCQNWANDIHETYWYIKI